MKRILSSLVLLIGMMAVTPSAQAGVIAYTADLTGPGESPPNLSPGTGTARVDIDTVAHTLEVNIMFSGLVGVTTASHIHSATTVPGIGTAGVATQTPTFIGFPLGVTSGSYSHIFDTTLSSTYNPSFVTANGGTPALAEAALALGMAEGKAYVNIHTSAFGGGEIRGFLRPVPEPSTIALMAIGGLGLLATRRRRRS